MGELEFYADANEELRWRARADNGKIVGDSAEGYGDMADCVDGARIACQILTEHFAAVDPPAPPQVEKLPL
jgi:uncharacterized protein YegP (UPF0339 family)